MIMDRSTSRPPRAFVIDDAKGLCKFVAAVPDDLGITDASFACAGVAVASLQDGHTRLVFLAKALKGPDASISASWENHYSGIRQSMSATRPHVSALVREHRPMRANWPWLITEVTEEHPHGRR